MAGVCEIQLGPPVNVGSCINHKQEIAVESEHKNEISHPLDSELCDNCSEVNKQPVSLYLTEQ